MFDVGDSFSFDSFDFSSSAHNQKEEVESDEQKDSGSRRRKVAAFELSPKYEMRRAYVESNLLQALGTDFFRNGGFKKGTAYHFITAGDVDSISFLRLILLQQPLDYLLFSTWVLGSEDLLQIDHWIDDGKLNKVDAYLGEIFPKQYAAEYFQLKELFNKHKCGRYAVFRNHSKVFAGYGKGFHFVVESSANMNTNPRTEQAVITINKELFEFYKSYFDGINSIVKD